MTASTLPDVRLEFTDPDAKRIESADGFWFLAGCRAVPDRSIERLVGGAMSGEAFCRSYRDALVVHVALIDGVVARVQAWRGLFSIAELFYAVRDSGDVRVSDHFKNVVAWLTPAERATSDRGLVEHYLTRKPFGNTTYVAMVTRLGLAEALVIDTKRYRNSTKLFDRIDTAVETQSPAGYLEFIDREMGVAVDRESSGGRIATMFSGGVDSALLQAYLGGRADAVAFVPDTPEYRPETECARNAAALIGVPLTEVQTLESDFVEMVETTTDLIGYAVFDDAKPYLAQPILRLPHSRFVTGHGADSAFGMSLKLARFSSWFRWPGVRQTVAGLSRISPGHLGYRLGQVAPIAASFAVPATDPLGYAGGARSHGKTAILEEVFGSAALAAVNQGTLDYTMSRLERTADPRSTFFSHIELAHWATVFNNPVLIDGLVAHAVGKSVTTPYVAANVLEALATIPVADRYVKRLQAKWMLKDLLRRKVPDYPINQRKLATALPWQRFYRDGPLTGFWDRYEMPEIFQGRHKDELVDKPTILTWTAMIYAVWQARIEKNADLGRHPAALRATYPIYPSESRG
jgi:asparagine synthase (glutamine-hydrolysing)